jgi:hypothetical protein
MKNSMPSPLLIAFISLAFSLSADTYYVSTEGNTENDGSREKPWPTVEHALAQVGGGKTILVRPGTYRGPIHIARAHAGTAERPTVIQSEVKWGATIIGAPYHVISNSSECDWLVVDGFEVMGGRYDGIKMNGDHNLCLPESDAQGTHGLSSDPRFVDATRGVFWLRANSPAIAAGWAEHAPARDFWGRSRPKAHPPDLGAFPYVPELEKEETRAEWDHGWAYHRHGQKTNVLPDLWSPR